MLISSIYALGSVVIVSLVALIGLFALSFNEKNLRRAIFVLVSLAVGALFGDAFIHLIPEAYAETTNTTLTSLLIIGGFLIFFIFEKFLNLHHSHGGEEDPVHGKDGHCNPPQKKNAVFSFENKINPLGYMVLVSDSFHNFIDGIIIGVSYSVSIEVGIASTIAIILHEIPQEIGDFGILLHSGFTKVQALFANFISALFAILGVLLVLFLGNVTEELVFFALPIAAGGFIYIAASDLVPELHKVKDTKRSLIQFLAILVGIASMLLLLLLE